VGYSRIYFDGSYGVPNTVDLLMYDVYILMCVILVMYRGADKSLARPGKKQATATEDFDVHISYL
jgi:hypothetical protein